MYNLYVDGSYRDSVVSWAWILVQDNKEVASGSGRVTDPQAIKTRNVAGELSAAMRGAWYCIKRNTPLSKITIYHDYLGIAKWAEGNWKTKNPVTKAYRAWMLERAPGVQFQHVRGHSGDVWNERVDKLAKEALNG